jgi:hypothetical protein
MEKGDKPKKKEDVAKVTTTKKKKLTTKSGLKKKGKKVLPTTSQIVKVNVKVGKDLSEAKKPIRKDITKQTTYLTLERPYALPVEEEEKLTITKFIPTPPRDKSSVKVSTVVSNPIEEIVRPNIEVPLQEPSFKEIPQKKASVVKSKSKFSIFESIPEVLQTVGQLIEIKDTLLAKQPKSEPSVIIGKAYIPVKTKKPVDISGMSGEDEKTLMSQLSNPEQQFEITPVKKSKLKPVPLNDYIANTDDAKISNPNTGEIINIENEPELEQEFGLSSSQILGYSESGEMKPSGTIIGMLEALEKRPIGRPSKYSTEEERINAIKEQKRQSKARIDEERKARTQERVSAEYEAFLEGQNPFQATLPSVQYTDLEQSLLTEIVLPQRKFAKDVMSGYITEQEKGEQISSDFISNLVDKTSERNNYNLIQSNQGPNEIGGDEILFE